MEEIIEIGLECFANGDATVIGYKGDTYHKSCEQVVFRHPDGSATYCTKRAGHPSLEHEDFGGTTLTIRMGEIYG